MMWLKQTYENLFLHVIAVVKYWEKAGAQGRKNLMCSSVFIITHVYPGSIPLFCSVLSWYWLSHFLLLLSICETPTVILLLLLFFHNLIIMFHETYLMSQPRAYSEILPIAFSLEHAIGVCWVNWTAGQWVRSIWKELDKWGRSL